MNRRDFIALGAAGALGLLGESRMAGAQTPAPPAVPYGASRLGISDNDRDATLYVPKSYQPGVPMPLMMMLHGFAGTGDGVNDTQMPIDKTARVYVPKLKADGYDVTYHEYQGGHRVPPEEIREAFKWFVGSKPQ